MPPKGVKKSLLPKPGDKLFSTSIIPQTPTLMRLGGSRKKSILTLCTPGVFAGTKTKGYSLDPVSELDRLIAQAMDADFRLGSINFGLPPVSHVMIIMKLESELRVYDVQHQYAAPEHGIKTWYEDFSNQFCDCTGYRYFVDGLLARMREAAPEREISLRLMPSPELSPEIWKIIDYGAETGLRPCPTEVRGPCMLWADAVLNRHWKALLEEAFSVPGQA